MGLLRSVRESVRNCALSVPFIFSLADYVQTLSLVNILAHVSRTFMCGHVTILGTLKLLIKQQILISH